MSGSQPRVSAGRLTTQEILDRSRCPSPPGLSTGSVETQCARAHLNVTALNQCFGVSNTANHHL